MKIGYGIIMHMIVFGNSQLCGTRESKSSVDSCNIDSKFKWTSCCAFGDQCRKYEVQVPELSSSCNSPDSNRLSIKLVFNLDRNDTCCESCTCYGDPECVSFGRSFDKWIVCDARESSCRITKSVCDTLLDHNNNKCVWKSPELDNKNWDVGLLGSPCEPNFTSGKLPMMNMMNIPSLLNIDLILGERGVITAALLKIKGDKTFIFNASKCFSDEANPFTGEFWPAAKIIKKISNESIKWSILYGNVYVRILCIRVRNGNQYSNPRLNVQEVMVPNEKVKSNQLGFCATGIIIPTGSVNPNTDFLHDLCVQNVSTPLQACKNLIDFGSTTIELKQCATRFCETGQFSNQQRADCNSQLVSANDFSTNYGSVKEKNANRLWIYYYCKSLRNLGIIDSSSNCEHQINAEGWPYAVGLWGNGKGSNACATTYPKIKNYLIVNKKACDKGVFIDVYVNKTWLPKYFIPETTCPLEIIVNQQEALDLFKTENKMRIRQCDNFNDQQCDTDRCLRITGMEASITYNSVESTLTKLYKKGNLCTCDKGKCEPLKIIF